MLLLQAVSPVSPSASFPCRVVALPLSHPSPFPLPPSPFTLHPSPSPLTLPPLVPLLELLHAFHGTEDVRDTHAELVVDHDDLTARDELLIDQHFKGFTNLFAQFDNRSLT